LVEPHVITYLDVQHYPDIFQSRLRKILEQVNEARHWLMGLFQSPHLAEKLIVAVDDFLGPTKAALQVLVLAWLSIGTLAEGQTTYVGQDDNAVFGKVYISL
jgi:hypothetical protein